MGVGVGVRVGVDVGVDVGVGVGVDVGVGVGVGLGLLDSVALQKDMNIAFTCLYISPLSRLVFMLEVACQLGSSSVRKPAIPLLAAPSLE